MVCVCGFSIKGLLESLTPNRTASFIGSRARRRGNGGSTGQRVKNLGLGAGTYSTGQLSYTARTKGGTTLQSGGREGQIPGSRKCQTSLPWAGEQVPSPPRPTPPPRRAPQPSAHALALRTGSAQAAVF